MRLLDSLFTKSNNAEAKMSSYRWAYRFFRMNGNGIRESLIRAFLLRTGHQVSIYPLGESVIRDEHSAEL